MKSSIRNFLLINLLLAITITTTLTTLGNYFLDQEDIQEHLDGLMALSTLSYEALIADDLKDRHLYQLQNNLDQIPAKLEKYYKRPHFKKYSPEHFIDKFTFQVLDYDNNLLLKSASSESKPIINEKAGFSTIKLDAKKWRVFASDNKDLKIRTILAESYDTRNELGFRIAMDDLYIMLLTFPLSGLLIWIIVSKGIESLEQVTEEVSNRAPSHLEPVDLKDIPKEIKPLTDELNKLFYRLKRGFEREKRFAADAAHELRTPLAALKTQAQVALNIDDPDKKNQALSKLIASVNRSTHIVQQLLTMSKLVPETITELHYEDINIIKIAREILAMLASTAMEKQIELELDCENVPSFKGNSTAIGILIRNLVDNAIRYCNTNDKVTVKISKTTDTIILQVSDTGPGIPDELQERVFERFFRALGSKSPGSGLGLSIVQQIAEMHNANIIIRNQENASGLIVKVLFPLISKYPLI